MKGDTVKSKIHNGFYDEKIWNFHSFFYKENIFKKGAYFYGDNCFELKVSRMILTEKKIKVKNTITGEVCYWL